jgi:hypothetical protein
LQTLLFVNACIHTQKPFTNFDVAYGVHTSWLSNAAHTCVCVCACVRERGGEGGRDRDSSRMVVEAKFVIVIESFVMTGLGKQNS